MVNINKICKILKPIGMYAMVPSINNVSFSVEYEAGSWKNTPIPNGRRIPKVTHNYERLPIGPLYSVGATSARYLGQNREKAPAAAPNTNLPPAKT